MPLNEKEIKALMENDRSYAILKEVAGDDLWKLDTRTLVYLLCDQISSLRDRLKELEERFDGLRSVMPF
jgi:hypothetical protein